jgi:SAM-dependent methyltransferase
MPTVLTWMEGDRFALGERTFQASAADGFAQGARLRKGDVLILKPRLLVDRYAALIEETKPQHIFELGIYGGGGTLFFAELAEPRRIVSIDLRPLPKVRAWLAREAAEHGYGHVASTFGEVDQSDRARLAAIVGDSFDGALDLIVDDCSHMYEPTRASFNELFPRLRPGGVYVIEDWRWAHTEIGSEHPDGLYPDRVPLTRLLFEIVLAAPSIPGLIDEITIDLEAIMIRRGHASVDPAGFDIATCSNPRGQGLLTPT